MTTPGEAIAIAVYCVLLLTLPKWEPIVRAAVKRAQQWRREL